MKQGELVTVNFGEANPSSNTYQIARKLEGESVLTHPLSPGCYVIKNDTELNQVLAQLKSPYERCLEYSQKFRRYLDYNDQCDLDGLCLYFVVNRRLSARQKHALSKLCGLAASIFCQNDLSVALRIVNQHRALLDDYNATWYQNFQRVFKGERKAQSQKQRQAIFNIAGFVLAQIEGI